MTKIYSFIFSVIFMTVSLNAKAQNYGFKVADIDVTAANAADLTTIEGVTGTVSYDPATNTLTLDNATITAKDYYGKGGIYNKSNPNLKIKIIGDCKIDATRNTGIWVEKKTDIIGTGDLSVNGYKYGVYNNGADLTIEDCNVTLKGGYYGIYGRSYQGRDYTQYDANLTVKNATVKATGKSGSIVKIKTLTLDGVEIITPDSATFVANEGVKDNGEVVKTEVVISKSASTGVENAKAITVSLSPNPIKDIATIQADNFVSATLYTVTGKQVLFTSTQTFSVQSVPSGVYVVRITTTEGEAVQRCIIE